MLKSLGILWGEENKEWRTKEEGLVNELRQAMLELFKIAVYYSYEKELEKSIEQALSCARKDGLI